MAENRYETLIHSHSWLSRSYLEENSIGYPRLIAKDCIDVARVSRVQTSPSSTTVPMYVTKRRGENVCRLGSTQWRNHSRRSVCGKQCIP